MRDQQAAKATLRGDLSLTICARCGFVTNSAFEPGKLFYGPKYDNDQTWSPTFSAHVKEVAARLVAKKDLRGASIVEVGCGNGDFLKQILGDESRGNVGYGFDPSYKGPTSTLGGRLRFERGFYDETSARVAADVVVCRHVIEHVPDPMELLVLLRRALVNSTHARIVVETPCVEWIFRNRVIWDLFYEHCCLFSSDSLGTAFEIAGFVVESIEHVFGGQYLLLGGVVEPHPVERRRNVGELLRLADEYSVAEASMVSSWTEKVKRLRKSGKVAVWGAGAKGVTFANLIDPRAELIDCVVDLNPNKQGGFVAGTGHPIVDYHDLVQRSVSSAVLMNPNYRDENESMLRNSGISVELVQ
jgi:SAM-dependent methyltransferase